MSEGKVKGLEVRGAAGGFAGVDDLKDFAFYPK